MLREDSVNGRKFINKRHLEQLPIIKAHDKVDSKSARYCFCSKVETGGETSYFSSLRDTIYQKAISKGVLLRPLGNVIYIIPSIIKSDELDKIYQTINEILDEV